MPNLRSSLLFIGQWTVIGLAVACLALLIKGNRDKLPPATTAAPQSYADAVARTAPAVVNIVTERLVNQSGRKGGVDPTVQQSLGSGVIVDSDGHVITAQHVVACAQAVHVQMADGEAVLAEIVGTDPATDVAVLKIGVPKPPVAPLGSSDMLRPGDVVLAIGTPFGLTQTVTQGVISATGRGQLRLAAIESYIQTDAAINVGNSGGALINASGEVIGINTAALSQTDGSHGISFAIPINLVRGVMSAILRDGRVIRGWFGVDAETLKPEQAVATGLSSTRNLEITNVAQGSPADQAGLRKGDIILTINGAERTWDQALSVVADTPPGRTVSLTIQRGATRRDYTVMLVERHDDTSCYQ
jgi:S1-C subfamily serine protease